MLSLITAETSKAAFGSIYFIAESAIEFESVYFSNKSSYFFIRSISYSIG